MAAATQWFCVCQLFDSFESKHSTEVDNWAKNSQYLYQLSQFLSVLPLSSDWRESLDDLVELSFSENLFSLSVGALSRVPLPQQFCLTLQSHQLTKCVWKWWCKQCWQEHHRHHGTLKYNLSKSKAYLKKVHCGKWDIRSLEYTTSFDIRNGDG